MNAKKRNLILSVETATRGGSLAVLSDAEVCAVWRGTPGFSHSDGLISEIQNLLRQTGTKAQELSLLAAAIGPGSFTDLRIGLAIVKGLAAVWDIPVIGVPTLEAMAFGVSQINPVCSLFPAGREEFFAQIFRGQAHNIPDQLRSGRLEKLLIDLTCESKLSFVAPVEIHQTIAEYIEEQHLSGWSIIAAQPDNLAVCVGRLAVNLFRQNESKSNSWQLMYGREAIVTKKSD